MLFGDAALGERVGRGEPSYLVDEVSQRTLVPHSVIYRLVLLLWADRVHQFTIKAVYFIWLVHFENLPLPLSRDR